MKTPDEKKLPLCFIKGGFKYNQVKRDSHYAIYSQANDAGIAAYELIRIRNNHRSDNGNLLHTHRPEGTELYPKTSEWGLYGWTCLTLQKAIEKMEEMRMAETAEFQFPFASV